MKEKEPDKFVIPEKSTKALSDDGLELLPPLIYEENKIVTGGIIVNVKGKKRKVKSMVGRVINLEKEKK